jgi:hypothetical protein
MSRSTTLIDRIAFIREELESDLCRENPQYAKWLEEEQLPKLQLELLSKGRMMDLATLKQSPADTKMVLPVTVVAHDVYQEGKYGYRCFMKVRDASGEEQISYSAGDPQKNPIYPKPGQKVTMKLSRYDNGQYRNISGYVTNEQPGQATPQPPLPPSQAPPQQSLPPAPLAPPSSPPPSSSPPRTQTPPQGNGQSFRGEDPKQFVAKQKAIMVQVAAKIVSEQQIAGKITGETPQAIQFWADAMWAVCRYLGTESAVPPFQPDEGPGIAEDDLPF